MSVCVCVLCVCETQRWQTPPSGSASDQSKCTFFVLSTFRLHPSCIYNLSACACLCVCWCVCAWHMLHIDAMYYMRYVYTSQHHHHYDPRFWTLRCCCCGVDVDHGRPNPTRLDPTRPDPTVNEHVARMNLPYCISSAVGLRKHR